MPLLRNNEIIENDPWTFFDDEQELHSDWDYAIVTAARFLQLASDGEQLPDGVRVAPDDDVHLLKPYISQLKLICISFPVYTDGRGYSHARLVRQRFGYKGELRAVGDIREDHISFMQRSGINAFDCISMPDLTLLKQLITRFEHTYQPSYPLSKLG